MHRHGRVGRKFYDLATRNTDLKSLVIFHSSDPELKTTTVSFQPLAFNPSLLLAVSDPPPRSLLIIISCLLCNINAPHTSAKEGSSKWLGWEGLSQGNVHIPMCMYLICTWRRLFSHPSRTLLSGGFCLASEMLHAPDQYSHEGLGKGSDFGCLLLQEKSPMIPELFNTINSHRTGLNLPSVCYLYHHQC